MAKVVFVILLVLVFALLLSEAASGGKSSGASSGSKGLGSGSGSKPKGHIPKTVLWNVPPSSLMVACFFFICAIILPLLIKWFLHRLEGQRPEQAPADAYGTFEPIPSKPSSSRGPDPTRVTRADLPPHVLFKWDRASWRLVHEELELPLALTAFVVMISVGIEFLRIPNSLQGYELRGTVEQAIWLACVFCFCWILWRGIDLVIDLFARQAWVARSRMTDMFSEISGQAGFVLKILGSMLIIVCISGLLSAEESYSQKLFIMFLTALAFGLVGWMLWELSDHAAEMASAVTQLYYNMYNVGDEIEVFDRHTGNFRGTVISTDTRTSEIVTTDGKIANIPNIMIAGSVICNYSRSLKTLTLDMYMSHDNTPAKLREFANLCREKWSHHPMAAPDTTPTCGFHGGFTTSYIPLSFHMFISQELSPGDVRDAIQLELLALAQEEGVKLCGA